MTSWQFNAFGVYMLAARKSAVKCCEHTKTHTHTHIPDSLLFKFHFKRLTMLTNQHYSLEFTENLLHPKMEPLRLLFIALSILMVKRTRYIAHDLVQQQEETKTHTHTHIRKSALITAINPALDGDSACTDDSGEKNRILFRTTTTIIA